MNHHELTRSLRLERLESRSLLAGGVFDFTFDGGNPQRSSNDNGRSTPAQESQTDARSRRADRNDARDGLDSHHRDVRGDRGPVQTQGHAQLLGNLPFANPPLVNPPLGQRPTFNTPPVARTGDLPPIQQVANQAAINRTAVNQAAINPVQSAAATLAAEPQVSEVDEAIESLTSASATRSTPEFAVEIAKAFEVSESPTDAFNDFRAEADRDPTSDMGFIELAPFIPMVDSATILNRSSSGEVEPWSLNRATVPMLQRMLEATLGERAEIADASIDDWFADGDGMIALGQVVLPNLPFTFDTLPIDVRLESTLMLGRTWELVAGGATSTLSGPVLDTIMASLQKNAMSESQPIAHASLFNSPAIAYPVAIIATTLAISNRRKHKLIESNLQHTKPSPT